MSFMNEELKKSIDKSLKPVSDKIDKLYMKCNCVSQEVKKQIMDSNLSDNIKQKFSSIRTCSELIKIEDFVRILHKEILQTHFASRPIIYKVRERVSEKLGITDEEFNNYLFECVRKGWITLIEGSPFNGKETDWYDIAGRRFYYFEFIEDWKRKEREGYRADGILKFETDVGLK